LARRARKDAETRAVDVRDVADGTPTISLVFQPFKLARNTLTLLQLILLLRAQ
jgi:hypothetical protein